MSNQIYNYSSSYGGGGGTSSFYSLRATNPYLSDGGSSRLSSVDSLAAADTGMYSDRMSSLYSKSGDGSLRLSGSNIAGYGAAGSLSAAGKIGGGIGTAPASRALFASSSLDPMVVGGAKRSVEALYNQSILGSHNTIGQSDAPFSSNSLVKRSRLETASNLPIYPQRPGEKDCAHYMLTRTCTFGNSCKFDHPIWVPEGGIPDWKEIPLVPASESLPEKPGEPDCPYYMKTQKCKFGSRCKFNHPKDKLNASSDEVGGEGTENSVLPERPSEPLCSFYAKTGKCKFGPNCKFHHPKDLKIPPDGEDTDNMGEMESEKNDGSAGGDPKLAKAHVSITPALLHNSKGLPIRPVTLCTQMFVVIFLAKAKKLMIESWQLTCNFEPVCLGFHIVIGMDCLSGHSIMRNYMMSEYCLNSDVLHILFIWQLHNFFMYLYFCFASQQFQHRDI